MVTLINDYLQAGYYELVWDGTNAAGQPVASGIYLYELVTGEKRLVRKMLLAR